MLEHRNGLASHERLRKLQDEVHSSVGGFFESSGDVVIFAKRAKYEDNSRLATIREEHRMMTGRIEINPAIMLGKPVIRGTCIPVELIIRKLSEGATDADLLDAYRRLTREDIQATLAKVSVTSMAS